jgi:hypothetical protein
MHNL